MTGKPARLLLAGCLWLLAGGGVTGLGLAAYGTLPRVGWLRPVLSLVVFQVADAPFLFLAWTETRRLRWDTQDRRPLHQALSLRTWLTLAGVTVDPRARQVWKDGEEIALTPKEYDLLLLFLRNPNAALYRDTIYEKVWGGELAYGSKTVDLHVQRLRKKVGWEETLRAVHKVGYRLEAEP